MPRELCHQMENRFALFTVADKGGSVPVVFRSGSYRFFFYSDEGRPREAPHIHVRQGSDEAKFWLQPDVGLVYNDGFNARELNRL